MTSDSNVSVSFTGHGLARFALALIGAAVLAVLAVYFNEPDVGNEGALLTWVSVALLLGTALVSGFRCATAENKEKFSG